MSATSLKIFEFPEIHQLLSFAGYVAYGSQLYILRKGDHHKQKDIITYLIKVLHIEIMNQFIDEREAIETTGADDVTLEEFFLWYKNMPEGGVKDKLFLIYILDVLNSFRLLSNSYREHPTIFNDAVTCFHL